MEYINFFLSGKKKVEEKPEKEKKRDPSKWMRIPEHWKGNEQVLYKCIQSITITEKYLMIDVPTRFVFDFSKAQKVVRRYKQFDPKLQTLIHFFVGDNVFSEEEFWKRYFFCVRLAKNSRDEESCRESLEEHYRTSKAYDTQQSLREELEALVLKSELSVSSTIKMIQYFIQKRTRTKEEEEQSDEEFENRVFDEIERLEEEKVNKSKKKKKNYLEDDKQFDVENEEENEEEIELEDRFDKCVELKKILSSKIIELDIDEFMDLIEKTQRINQQFHGLMEEYIVYEELLKKKEARKKKRTLILSTASFNPELLRSRLTPPSFTNERQRRRISLDLPIRFRRMNWVLLYATEEHGISLISLLQKTEKKGETLCFLYTKSNEVIGFFHGSNWKHTRKYYGRGESFVFRFKKNKNYRSYKWSKKNKLFFLTNCDQIRVGGGISGGPAISVDNDINFGSTHKCETYDSDPLLDDEDFIVVRLEVWGFEKEKKSIKKFIQKVKLSKEEKIEQIEQKVEDSIERYFETKD